MFSKFHLFIIRIFVIVTFLISCSPATTIPATPTSTFSKFLPPTWTPTTTLTPTVTKTLLPTVTPTLTSTVTRTLPPSLTPLPTISIDKLALHFEILLATNGGCRLPCFWGVTPGITSVAELNQFVRQFPEDLIEIDSDHYTIYYVTSKTGDTSFSIRFLVSNDVVRSIDLGGDTGKYYMTLPKLLSDYGMPEKVLIGPPEFENYLSMLVIYDKQRFIGKYFLFQNELDRALYCYDPQFSPYDVLTWSTQKGWQDFINQEAQSYKTLSEVSDYDVAWFYQSLKIHNRTLCMHLQTDKILP